MLNIAHKIQLGPSVFQSSKNSRLLELDARAELAVPVNSCRMELDGLANVGVEPGAEVKLDLGYGTTIYRVFTGKVATVSRAIGRTTVDAMGSFAALASGRYNRVYQKQNASDIVTDLLKKAGAPKGMVETGLNFESYVVSDHEAAWQVLCRLALHCGCDFYAGADGKAVFKRFVPQKIHPLSYGADIIEFEQDRFNPPLDGVEVYGESPAGQGQGTNASSWLTKKQVKGAAGQTFGRLLRTADPSLTSQSMARSAAVNMYRAQKTKARARLRAVGMPKVRLCDAVQISHMPNSAMNGQLKVTGVRHRLNSNIGFITEMELEKL